MIDISKIKVTNDPSVMDNVHGVNEKIRAILTGNYPKLSQKSIIEKLLNDIEKYPTIPQFKQQLCTAYKLQNWDKKANDCNTWMLAEHPDYLFGLINKAYECYYLGNFEAMKLYLGEHLNIMELYPDRKEFHEEEIMNYFGACAMYYNATATDNTQQNMLFDIMKQLNKNNPVIKRIEEAIALFNKNKNATKPHQ